jgi:pyruvate kinase
MRVLVADPSASGPRTKLVCTIGPASIERVDELAAAGMDVARINFAHGTAATQLQTATAVRRAAADAGRPLAILVDLAGPKIRLGPLEGVALDLEAGAAFDLRPSADAAGPGDVAGAAVSDPDLASELRVGDPVFLADGAVELRVVRIDDVVRTEVVRGGTVRSRAGVVIPAARSSSPALTAKDREDLRRLPELGATYVGQSFVRSAADVVELRRALGPEGPRIVAKIETRPAVDAFESILEVADGIMVARGDLGIELPFEDVPIIQKQLVRRALDRGVPSIVATQMLESMTSAPRPTRAEASDVANAVFDGADAVMLSGETAIGAYPVEAATAATRIVARCEAAGEAYLPAGSPPIGPVTDADAVTVSAVELTRTHREIDAICCSTLTGRTARLLASLRPRVPIIAFSPDPAVVDQLALVDAVVPRVAPVADTTERIDPLLAWLAETRLLPPGARVVFVSSTEGVGAPTQLLGIHRMADPARA